MASFVGYSSPSAAVVPGISPPDFPTHPAYAAAIDPPRAPTLYGARAAGAFAVSSSNFSGYLAHSACGEEDGFVYGKVYLNQTTIEAGSVAAVREYTLQVWNAHLNNINFVSKAISQAGVTLNNGALPILFYPTQTRSYTITIDDDGSPTIRCDIDLTFTDSELRTVVITGFRAAAWAWWPQIPISETIKPATWIFESENGKEQRGKLRDRPRRSISFDALVTEAEWRTAQNIIRNRHGSRWVLPLFEQAQFVSASYAQGDVVITVDTTAAEYYSGGLAIIWQDSENWFISEISSKTSANITLQSALDAAYSGALRIAPAVSARLSGAVSNDSDREGNRKIKASFDVFTGADLSGATDSVSLGNYGVMTWPTEAPQVAQTFKTKIWSVDFDNGLVDFGSSHLRSLRSMPQKTTLLTRAEIYAFKRWVHTKHGAVPFWVPTRFKDLYLSANLSAATSSFRVINNDLLENSVGAVAVALFYPDGTVDYRQVDSLAAYSGTETTVSLSAATTNSGILTPAEVRICWLLLCRLDGEPKLTHTGYDASASFTVKEVMQ